MSNLDTSFLLALAGAVLGGASMVLHVVAPRTKNTIDDKLRDDIDEVLGFIRGQNPTAAAVATPSAPKPPIATATMLAVFLAAICVGGMSTACSPDQRTAVEHALWDCTAPERAQLVTAVTPLADSAIQKATNPDGTIDTTTLKATFSKANLLSDAGTLLTCAAANAFAALMATGQMRALSVATPVDVEMSPPRPSPSALRQAFDELRAAQFPGVTFKTPNGEI